MEYLYDQKTRKWIVGFGKIPPIEQPKVSADINDLKDARKRASNFIRIKSKYSGLPNVKYVYHNKEDFAFSIDKNISFCFKYNTSFIKSTNFVNKNDIYAFNKWKKYFEENENYEKLVEYLNTTRYDIIWTHDHQRRQRLITHYIYVIDSVSSSMRLLLETNNDIDHSIY